MSTRGHSPLEHLKTLAQGLRDVQMPQGTPDPARWRDSLGLARSRMTYATHQVVGLTPDGLLATARLSDSIRASDPALRRGTTAKAHLEQLVEFVLDRTAVLTSGADESHLASLTSDLLAWFASASKERTHLVPCTIIPRPAAPFAIGPIRFKSLSHIELSDLSLPQGADVEFALGSLPRMMADRAANWVAFVTVPAAEPERSAEIANCAADVAIAGLQLILGGETLRNAARISGRTLPPFIASVSLADGNVSTGTRNIMPGLAVSPAQLEHGLQAAAPFISSVGNRLAAYLAVSPTRLPSLQQAWCDAAFWYHQAIAEPLATVGVAMLEVSLENLFAAGNSSGSSKRIRKTLEAVFGVKPSSPLFQQSPITMEQFVESVVKARSRILHGTWSTLADDLPVTPDELSPIARDLLLLYTRKLDAYLQETSASDDADAFLDWLAQNPKL